MIGTASRSRPNFVDDARALGRVRLHLGVLPVVELRGLDEDRVGDGDLADVVEERAEAQRVELLRASVRAPPPIASAIRCTRSEWPAVSGSFASTVAFRLSIASSELSSSRA